MKLYHYMPADHLKANLQERWVKASALSELNDPFELLAANLSNKVDRAQIRKWADEQDEAKAVLCFSRSWRNPVMWSHYADRHRGICLGFEVDRACTTKVEYARNRVRCRWEMAGQKRTLSTESEAALLRTKFKQWEYEQEQRVYVDKATLEQRNGLYFQPFSDWLRLKEIRLGHGCTIAASKAEEWARKLTPQPEVIKTRRAFQTYRVCLVRRKNRNKDENQ